MIKLDLSDADVHVLVPTFRNLYVSASFDRIKFSSTSSREKSSRPPQDEASRRSRRANSQGITAFSDSYSRAISKDF